ncbi:A/G-specific adenine glycosylase [Echinimonas agarilytica]|uniref:Adenine DNA glycosylase n=1 Tax=Echinimonas agarilytica TaxID=1215918 RepID=A0AA41W7P5_9GAMM|nr:A/G-specific adenine glycosylase [Echinimonas agarilytica]MCM2680266.1 A/G-specific adenine glycosylase [Echinimonas agarilytica]
MISTDIAHIPAPEFAQRLLEWAAEQGRHDLPWQIDATPYSVLVSEIMLQQTQVATVIPYYQRWLKSFPTVEILANAHEDQVMAHWQGLGYYSRARNLHKAAKYVLDSCNGQFPNDLKGLEAIPGVGRYTAGAVMSFAYDNFGPIVDGNVRRLFCRLFGIDGLPTSTAVTKTLWALAEHYTPQTRNRNFAQGLLDMGATLCTPKSPKCERCCFADDCIAKTQDRVTELPTPKPKKVIPTKNVEFIWHVKHHKIFLQKRPDSGIWGGLWCLPESDENQVEEKAKSVGKFKHTFSHYKLDATVVHRPVSDETGQWFSQQELRDIGLPKPIQSFIDKHFE